MIADKRDGVTLPEADVERFVRAYTDGEVGDGQAAAFLMAALLNGLDADETLAMTRAMIASGDTVSFPAIAGPIVDKHSTGGVADGVTLIFAPLAAAVGLQVAKLSGRGLGHTGGTLDKLEAIPGLRTDLSPGDIERQVAEVGCAIAAPSPRLVPADGALYALRDATATVPSVALIAASVMSKKLAVETDLIVLDVKTGSGAFMKTVDVAGELADACVALAAGAGRRCGVAVTDMSQPLGDAVGNALDVIEAVEVLRCTRRGRLGELVIWFVAKALGALTGREDVAAVAAVTTALDDGSALERFRAMVAAQGGDPRVADDPVAVLASAAVEMPILADRSGTLAGVDAEAIGLASSVLGAGRLHKGDTIDPAVGLVVRPKIGDRIERGEAVGMVHARTAVEGEEAATKVLRAMTLVDDPVEAPPLVHAWRSEAR